MRRLELLALALLALLQLGGAAASADIDDALITYRYAENLAAGRGFSYNPGESVWGTSTPLFTLALAVLAKAGVPPPLGSHWLGWLSAIVVVILAAHLAQRLSGSRLAGWLAGLWCALCAPLAVWASSGMETLSYTALLLGAWSAAQAGRTLLVGLLAGLAFLMRADGLILLPALASYFLLVERRPLPWRGLGVFVLVIAPWCLFALWRFGALLPHSFAAKRMHPKLAPPGWFWHYYMDPDHWWPTLGAALIGWAGRRRRLRQPENALALSLGAWLLLYALAYSLAGLDYYEWYCIPPLPFLGLLAALGLERLSRLVTQRPPAAALVLASAGALLLASVVLPRHGYIQAHRDYVDSVEVTRRRIGLWLLESTSPGAVVKTGAVGQIGYYSRRPVEDHAQLVTLGSEAPADYDVAHDVPGGPPFASEAFLRGHLLLAVFVPPAPHQALIHRVYQRLGRPRAVPSRAPAPVPLEPGMVVIGRRMDFANEAVTPSLGPGWSVPEPGFGTWALGTSSRLRLGPGLPVAARVTIEWLPFAPPGAGRQAVAVEREEQTLATVVLQPGDQELVFVLPPATTAEDELTFRFDHASSPRAAGLGDDPRPLAVAFKRLLLEPLVDGDARASPP